MNEEISYRELLKERESLEQRIKQAHRREVSTAISRVREIVNEFNLTPQDVFPVGKALARDTATDGPKVAPKYRDPASGKTWTGRGKPPRWIQNQDREKFAI